MSEHVLWPPETPAPDGLKMPADFIWAEGALYQRRKAGQFPRRIARGPIVITGRYAPSPRSRTVYCQVAFAREGAAGPWETVVMPFGDFVRSQGLMRLQQVGAPIVVASGVREWLQQFYDVNLHVLPLWPAIRQSGWDAQGRYFWGGTLYTREATHTQGMWAIDPAMAPLEGRQVKGDGRPGLEWAWWRDTVLPRAPRLAVGLAAVAASVLLHFVGRGGFVMHLASPTSTGKTTALILLASLWGLPTEGAGLIDAWRTPTDKLAAWTYWAKDATWFLDDATHVSERTIRDRVYWMAGGTPPGQPSWTRGITISTGEDVLPVERGARARVVGWQERWIPAGAPVDAWRARVEVPQHYGWWLPWALQRVWDVTPETWRNRWQRYNVPRDGGGVAQRMQGYWATLRLGADLWPDAVVAPLVEAAQADWWATWVNPSPPEDDW